ncbi:hypothetical protein MK489_04800 [Myxococcota bacterium]|nr:hypothetical protein [Myxococcota bacterium]
MASQGHRIGIVGATGMLGSEVVVALDASPLRVQEIVPIATEASLGQDIECQGEVYPLVALEDEGREASAIRGLDLVILCAPPEICMEYARHALRAEVPCIDGSGALGRSDEVPLCAAPLTTSSGVGNEPVLACPSGAALSWALALEPLQNAAGLKRVAGTVLEAASVRGRRGVEALHLESIAMFNQQETAGSEVFGRSVAFDVWPVDSDPMDASPESPRLARELKRLLGAEFAVSASFIQVPAFVGQATDLWVETERPLSAAEAAKCLAEAPTVELAPEAEGGPSLRGASGSRSVVVGPPRLDPTHPSTLRLWWVSDVLSAAAANTADLAVARLQPD